MPYSQGSASIQSYENNATNERYGLPTQYSIIMSVGATSASTSVRAHWSRVIHIAEETTENDVFGTPRLEAVVNRLEDLERVVGGSGEMFWRGAFPGFGLKLASDASVTDQTLTRLQKEMQEYLHGLKRYIRLQGIDIQELKPQVADPSKHVETIVDLISAATRIPKRILLGSERGELASKQDAQNWAEHIDERRRNHCEPKILRPFVDRLIQVGVLPTPAEGYTVDWPDLLTPSDKDKAEVGEIKARALKAYVDAIGASDVVPPEVFLRKFLDFTRDEIDQLNEMLDEINKSANQADSEEGE